MVDFKIIPKLVQKLVFINLNRKMLKIGKLVIATFLLTLMLLMVFQDRIILHPIKLPKDYVYNFDLFHEELNFQITKDVEINGVFFNVKNPKGLVFYNHGNADHVQRWGKYAKDFTENGYDVFFYDYRGFGKSTGDFTEKEILNDALLVFDKISPLYNGKKVIIYGRSLGTGVATFVAKNRIADALILETPYFNLADVGKSWLPFVPFEKILKYDFPSNIWINDVKMPIVIFHGTSDYVVPYSSGKKLAASVACKLITIENGSHKNLSTFQKYHVELKKVLSF